MPARQPSSSAARPAARGQPDGLGRLLVSGVTSLRELHWPIAATGRPRKHSVPSEGRIAAKVMLNKAIWDPVLWRHGTK